MKSKVFFIMHMPPPIHGAAVVGKYIHDSQIINDTFDCYYLNLSLSKDLNEIGKRGIKKLFILMKQFSRIRKEIRMVKPDICYVTPNAKGGAFYKDFLIVMLLKVMGQHVVAHYHNKGVSTCQAKILDNFLYKLFFKSLKVILLAETLYEDISKYVDRKNVFFCSNGIPNISSSFLVPVKENNKVQLLFLSNMIATKGVWSLVEACDRLKKRGLDFTCHFVGKWCDITEKDFKDVIHKKGLSDCIIAHGAKYNGEKVNFFRNADIFVFPSCNDCFPIVLLEAMQQGLPCISTAEGGIPDIIDNGKTGYIVEKRNIEQLVEKISFLIEHSDLRKEMGENGYKKYCSKFTLQVFESRMKEILLKCCEMR